MPVAARGATVSMPLIGAVEALKKAGSDVKFTVYPEAGHDSWTATYDNPELYTWFLEHTRKKAEAAK